MKLRAAIMATVLAVVSSLAWVASAMQGNDVDSPTLFVRGNGAYDSGDFAQAAHIYESLVGRGADSGWVYYNLGNCYLRQGMLGRAIGAYRRAEARLPRQSDVRANLQFARQQARDALAPIEPLPFLRTVLFWHYGLSYHELTLAAAIFNALFWTVAAVHRWRRDAELWRWGTVATGAVLALLCGSMIWHRALPLEIAIVTEPEIDVHSGTHQDTVVRFKLHEGSEARVLDSDDSWLRIELADGKQGWVAASDVTKVAL